MVRQDLSDQSLIEATLHGDQRAFENIVRAYAPAVKAVSLAIVRSLEDADDVAQESFVKAYSGLGLLRDRRKFGSWLVEITRNTALTWSGKSRRREQAQGEILERPETAPDHALSELHRAVRQSLEVMPPADREVLLLHYFAGQSTREIGALLNVKPGAVQKRLQRARERLGVRLASALADAFDSPQGREVNRRRVMAAIALAPPPRTEAASASMFLSPAQLKVSGALFGVGIIVATTIIAVRTEYFGNQTATTTPVTAPELAPKSPASASIMPSEDAVGSASPSDAPKKTSSPSAISGRVIDVDGEGVAGAIVRAYVDAGDPPEIGTDANGDFALVHLPGSVATLRVTSEGFVPLTMPEVSRGTSDLTLVLLRRSSMSGRVVDAYDQTPIEQFSLGVQPTGGSYEFNDRDGRFHIEDVKPDLAIIVQVQASGYEFKSHYVGFVSPESQVDSVVVAMFPLVHVEGVVVDSSGHPVNGAEIRCKTSVRRTDGDLSAYSNEMGIFVLRVAPTQITHLVATHERFVATSVKVDYAKRGIRSDVVRLVLGNGGTIVGSLRRGAVLETRYRVVITLDDPGPDPDSPLASVIARLDKSGQFVRVAPAGRVTAIFQLIEPPTDGSFGEVRENIVTTATVQEGAVTNIDLLLPPADVSIPGMVIFEGSPAQASIIYATRLDGAMQYGLFGCNQDGVFQLDGLIAAPTQLVISQSRNGLKAIQILNITPIAGVNEPLQINLSRGATLEIHVAGDNERLKDSNVHALIRDSRAAWWIDEIFASPTMFHAMGGSQGPSVGISELGRATVVGLLEGQYTINLVGLSHGSMAAANQTVEIRPELPASVSFDLPE